MQLSDQEISSARSIDDDIDLPTDLDILNKYLEMGVKNIISVPCSITDTFNYIAVSKCNKGELTFISSNHEGNLPGIAAGIYFGTGDLALVHMQNSGLCNAADGFVSFANKAMFGIPMLVLITYRGADSQDDSEPHQEIGKRTDDLINLVFDEKAKTFGCIEGKEILSHIQNSILAARDEQIGIVKLSSKAFSKITTPKLLEKFSWTSKEYHQEILSCKGNDSNPFKFEHAISRDNAIRHILDVHPKAAILFCNGFNSRAAQNIQTEEQRARSFYNIGYMGGTLAIGWGLAKSNSDVEVVVIDGDQNAQMSSMKDMLSNDYPKNLYWYILNNHIGASVGTSPSIPLSPIYYDLARVIETKPDEYGSFTYPRVSGMESNEEDINSKKMYTLARITKRFRKWISSQSN